MSGFTQLQESYQRIGRDFSNGLASCTNDAETQSLVTNTLAALHSLLSDADVSEDVELEALIGSVTGVISSAVSSEVYQAALTAYATTVPSVMH